MRILHLGLMIDEKKNGFQKALINIFDECAELPTNIPNFNTEALKIAKKFKPNIIFIQIQQENVLNEYTAKELSKIGFCINFSGDVRIDLPQWYITIGKIIQLTTFNNMVDVKRARKAGINSEYLELGFDPQIYKKWGIKFETPDIVAHFNDYGNNYFPLSQYRFNIAEQLREQFGGQFGVYGNFPKAKGNLNKDQIRESQQYNNCKIAINCSHFNYERYSSDRQLRIMGSGAFCLSHHYDGIEEDYIIGEHLDTFYDLDDMIEKCNHYLWNEKLRGKIADAGYYYVKNNFTFYHMAKAILKLYEENK